MPQRQEKACASTGCLSDTENKIRLPRIVKILYIIAAACVPLYIAFLLSESFADLFNRHVSSLLRGALAYLTSWIPFSLAEFLIILIPLWVFLIASAVMKKYGESLKETISALICEFVILAVVFSIFTLGFASAYRGSTLTEKLGLETAEVSAEELYDTALILIDQINEEVEGVSYGADGFSIMPYGYNEMSDKLIDAYYSFGEDYDFLPRLDSRIKPVMLSEAMSYTHITGVYTFFTGEANVNVAFPDYTLPFTAAHELAHQRGIARENEANFMAFLVCSRSNDAYIRYCAYLNLYEYVANALYLADSTLYMKTWAKLPACVKGELGAYSSFAEKYSNSAVANVSGALNDTFLKLNGTEGTRSYGMVVDLAVAYFKPAQKS